MLHAGQWLRKVCWRSGDSATPISCPPIAWYPFATPCCTPWRIATTWHVVAARLEGASVAATCFNVLMVGNPTTPSPWLGLGCGDCPPSRQHHQHDFVTSDHHCKQSASVRGAKKTTAVLSMTEAKNL